MIKRLADWLEKMSVAALAVGIFQARFIGVICGIICFYSLNVDNQKAGVKMIEWIVTGIFCLCVGGWGLYLTRKPR